MKLLLVLFLFGLTGCLAQPSCSNEELLKCSKIGIQEGTISEPETEEELDIYCGSIICTLGYYGRCGNMKDEFTVATFNQQEKLYGTLCFTKNPLRKKFLDNIRCLNDVLKDVEKECRIDTSEMDRETFCKELKKALDCAYQVVTDKCNEDAKEVFEVIYPGYEYYGCSKYEPTPVPPVQPNCTNDDLLKCTTIEGKPISVSDSEEDLDTYCSSVGCTLGFYGRCGDMKDEATVATYQQHEKIYSKLCFRKSPLRRKFLNNITCLKGVLGNLNRCRIDRTQMDQEAFCEKLPEVLQCSYEVVTEKCGKEAKEVFEVLYPGHDFHGCAQ